MKAMIIYSQKWVYRAPSNEEKVKNQVRQLLGNGGGDILVHAIYDNEENAKNAYKSETYQKSRNVIMRPTFALLVVDDENSVRLYYRLEKEEPKQIEGFACELNRDVLPTLEKDTFYSQEDVEFEEFLEDLEEVPDYTALAIGRINQLIRFAWVLKYEREPQSITQLKLVSSLNMSDAKIVERAQKEMRTGEKELSKIYEAFKIGYEQCDFDAFDSLWTKFKDSHQLDNKVHDLYDL